MWCNHICSIYALGEKSGAVRFGMLYKYYCYGCEMAWRMRWQVRIPLEYVRSNAFMCCAKFYWQQHKKMCWLHEENAWLIGIEGDRLREQRGSESGGEGDREGRELKRERERILLALETPGNRYSKLCSKIVTMPWTIGRFLNKILCINIWITCFLCIETPTIWLIHRCPEAKLC